MKPAAANLVRIRAKSTPASPTTELVTVDAATLIAAIIDAPDAIDRVARPRRLAARPNFAILILSRRTPSAISPGADRGRGLPAARVIGAN